MVAEGASAAEAEEVVVMGEIGPPPPDGDEEDKGGELERATRAEAAVITAGIIAVATILFLVSATTETAGACEGC